MMRFVCILAGLLIVEILLAVWFQRPMEGKVNLFVVAFGATIVTYLADILAKLDAKP